MNNDILDGSAPRRVSRTWRFAAAVGTASLASGALLGVATAVGTPSAVQLAVQAQSTAPSATASGQEKSASGPQSDDRPPRRRAHAAGTVSSVNGSSFTVTRRDESTVTVNTSSSTKYFKTVDATVADASVGSYVGAHGTRSSNGSLAANRVIVRPEPASEQREPKPSTDGRHVRGEVTANDGTTLTIRTANGSQTVTTSSATRFFKTTVAALSAVTTGSRVHVGGPPAEDGSITAARVHITATSDAGAAPRRAARGDGRSGRPGRDAGGRAPRGSRS